LFSIKAPLTGAASEKVEEIKSGLKLQREALLLAKKRMTERAAKTAESVNLGKILEKIIPSFPSFGFRTGDCRALFEPVDYVVFKGLTDKGVIDALAFVDVKSGRAGLTSKQKGIKRIVEAGKLAFERMDHVRRTE